MDKTDRDPAASSPAGSTQDHLHTIADEAGSLLNQAKTQGTEQYEQYRDTAAQQLESLKEGAQSAAEALQGKDTLGLSQYLGQLAGYLGTFADQVRHQSAEELLQKGSRLARDNPGLFIAGSVAIGFGLSRFLRASEQRDTSVDGNHPPAAYGANEPYQSTLPVPDHGSDVSTHKPYTPVDPLGTTHTSPVTGSTLDNDPLKGGA
ncbi:hypothetical protein IV505_12245 [Pseudomonas fulva]|nr:hypothetical protein [Pseudomonas fulva]MBF8780494.1 hypothetical protein [Pseudomonas fulva]